MVLLEWGQARQGRPLVGTCLFPAGKRREQSKICQSNPVNLTAGWHRIPVGVMGWVIGACGSRKMRRGFFPPSSHWPAKPVSCERTFFKVVYLSKGRVALLAVQAVSWTLMHPAPGTVTVWQHCQSSCTQYQAVPIAACSHLKHRILCGSTALLMLFSLDSALQRERNCWWSQQQKREVRFSMQCRCYVFLTITVLWRALTCMDPERICRLCGVAGAGRNQAGIRVSH